jgi:hypothetical protein
MPRSADSREPDDDPTVFLPDRTGGGVGRKDAPEMPVPEQGGVHGRTT